MATQPLVNILHLRSAVQNAVPVNLSPGQIALNLHDALNPDANGNYFVEVFVGTGGNERRRDDGTDRTADALISSVSTGEALITGMGWVQTSLGGEYVPVPNLNLDAAGVTTYRSALDTLDTLLGLLTNLTTAEKTSVVGALNELDSLAVAGQTAVAAPTVRASGLTLRGGDLWVNTTSADALGNTNKLNYWNGTGWHEVVSDVADGGGF